MKVELNSVKLTINNVNYEFVNATYNGMEIIYEKTTGYINASSFCKQYNKRLGRFFEKEDFKEFIRVFKQEYKVSDAMAKLTWHENNEEWWKFQLNANIPKQHQRLRGVYIDSRIINYLAMWCSPAYLINVNKIMDSINEQVHERLEALQLTETPQNANTVFNLVVDETINAHRFVSDNENSQCYGVREHDNFDYLTSWDKDYIKTLWANFKHSLTVKLNLTMDELKHDYPQLLE